MKLNENIAKLRKERGLTQEQLANLLNVSVAAVSKWETGSNRPNLELLPDLAEVFQVSIDTLIGYEKSYKSLDQSLCNATQLISQNEYEAARNLLEALLKRYPNDFHINFLLAETYYSPCFSITSGRKKYIEKAILHARKYSQNPSLQISDMRYCENVKGRMIDTLQETIDWLLKQKKQPL